MNGRPVSGRRQRGAALVTALFLMLALLLVSVSATRAVLASGKSASAERDRLVAHAAAEAALADGESDIDGVAGASSPRTAIFAGADAAAFVEGCAGEGERLGLCRAVGAPGTPAWQAADLAGERGVDYGQFSGRALPGNGGPLPARAPRYLIELLAGPGGAPLYRVTAIGFGADATTIVVLQSYYRRAAVGAAVPGTRLGWREIANWSELHRAAS